MAQRRMISLKVIDTDHFLEMPTTSQNLYIHLLARADDDGFLGNAKKIMRIIRASEDDMSVLVSKDFVIPFDNGICVIKHWRIHNLIRSDRYTETIYKNQKRLLNEDENKSYIILSSDVIPNVIPNGTLSAPHMEPQYRKGKDSIGKISLGKRKESQKILSQENPYGNFVPKEKEKKWGNFKPSQPADKKPELKPDNRQSPLSAQINATIDYWNGKDNLPGCRFNVLTLPDIGAVNNIFNAYGEDDIKSAIDNLSKYWDKENYKPSSFQRFIVGSLDRWVDDCKPWERHNGNKPGLSQAEIDLDKYQKIREDFKRSFEPDSDIMKQANEKVAALEELVKKENKNG